MVQISRSDFTLKNLWCVYVGTDIRFFNAVVKRHAESAQMYGTVTREWLPCTRYLVQCTKYLVQSTKYLVHSVPGNIWQVFGTECTSYTPQASLLPPSLPPPPPDKVL